MRTMMPFKGSYENDNFIVFIDLVFMTLSSVSAKPNKKTLGLLLVLLAIPPALAQRTSQVQMEMWRKQIKETLAIPDPLPLLTPVSYGKFSPEPGVITEKVTYGTEYGMRVPAVIYRPEHAGHALPALVVVNGHGGDKYSWYSFYTGILYARAGAVVLTYDPIGEGERNSERRSGTRIHDRIRSISVAS